MTASPSESSSTLPASTTLGIGTTTIIADVVSTEAEREQGLSGRNSLAPGRGMYFMFDTADRWGIWMKDMKFPIDIVWISASSTIITIEKNVATSTYPTIFYPDSPALYVLELPAGFTKKQGIAVGQKVVVK
jgi:uncharacterized membrane protein (UPF0127 family)